MLLNDRLMALDSQKVTLTFSLPTSGFTEDEATGNQIPNTTTATYTVWLKAANPRQIQEIQTLAGLDRVSYPVFGRTTAQTCCFPQAVRDQKPCIATCTYGEKTGTIQLFLPEFTRGAFAKAGETFLAVFVPG